MVLVFVYGTLKTGFPNHFLLEDSKFGCAKLIGSGLTTEKYPLVIATPFFIPMMLNKPGTGEVRNVLVKYLTGLPVNFELALLQELRML